VITLVASAGVGYIYQLTAEPIAQANKQAEQEALLQVLPEFDATTVEALTIDQLPIEVNVATKQGEVVGYAVKSQTNSGFGGNIVMMVGFDTAGTILNVNVLKQAETPGLGTKMA
jgi:electron transport complex protein RnfG